jgi:hypothetical protein
MAKAPEAGASAPAASSIDPDARYEITVTRPIARRGRILSPMHRHVVTGRILMELPPEALADVQPV